LRPLNERAQSVSVISVSKNVSKKNVTLQNYESKKCCFKKSERKREQLKMGK